MAPSPPGSRDPLARLLGALERAEPPPVPLEDILERAAARRYRAVAAGVVGVAVLLLAALLLLAPEGREAPVHLEIRVIDLAPGADGPVEESRPELP